MIVGVEDVRRAGDLQRDVLAGLGAEGRLHLGHQRDLLPEVVDRHVDEDLRPEVLCGAHLRTQRPLPPPQRLRPEELQP